MYSIALMTVLMGGSATPNGHGCASCSGYPGGFGGGYEGCGCWGGYSNWGYCGMHYPGPVFAGGYGVGGGTVAPGTGGEGEELPKPKTKKNGGKDTMVPTPAKLFVELPPNAKLFIDDMPIKTAAGGQTFDTPALEPGQDYFYMVRIETMRDGQPLAQTRRIVVRAGQVARTDFKEKPAAPATGAALAGAAGY